MNKLIVSEMNYSGKRVLIRVDYNVPLDENQNITDDRRIQASLPTLRKVMEDGGKAILCSHLGRPKGKVVPEMSLKPVAKRLSELINHEVKFAPDCIGPEVAEMVHGLASGEVLLLENLRFHIEETQNDPGFATQLAAHGEMYINDAFGSAHRAHASTEGVTRFIDSCAGGFLMEKELKYLGNAVTDPKRPFVAILGGAKISGKIDVIQNLMDKVDAILIGGGMVFTFLKTMGKEIGQSLLEKDKIELAGEILKNAKAKNVKLILPIDCVVAKELDESADSKTVSVDEIPLDMKGLDIGSETLKLFKSELSEAKTVVWNGPMGVFEIAKFAQGTIEIAKLLAEITDKGAITIVGGGDSASAVKKAGLDDKLSHISTGGGASLEFLEGKILPGVGALSDSRVVA